jgi:transcription-repair coupling factor (superfamily II helicase)
MELGFETYEKILAEAVSEIKDEEFKELFAAEASVQKQIETTIDTDLEALIPDFYVEKDSERLEIYRRLYRMDDTTKIDDIKSELQDRFGEYPPEVENLFKIIELKIVAARFRITRVEMRNKIVTLTFPDKSDETFYGSLDQTDSYLNRFVNFINIHREMKPKLREVGTQLLLEFKPPLQNDSLKQIEQIINILKSI